MRNYLAVGAVLLALVALGVAYFRPVPEQVVKITEVVREPLGAVSGPDISSPYLTVNGQRRWFFRDGFKLGTSTPCAFQSPGATSSLVFFGMNQTTATSVAVTWTVATSTHSNGTTSRLYEKTWAANNLFSIAQTGSTTAAGQQSLVLGPTDWVVYQGRVSQAGESGGGAALSTTSLNPLRGTCTAEMVEL